MSDKAMLLRDADEAFGELHRAIDGLTDEETGRVWLGTWGVREILIHISGWHDAMAAALDNIAKGEPGYAAGMYDDYDAWNARFVEQRAGVKVADVIAELDASHRRFVGGRGRRARDAVRGGQRRPRGVRGRRGATLSRARGPGPRVATGDSAVIAEEIAGCEVMAGSTAQGFTLFDTAIGRCGIAWGERGVVGVQLPEAREPRRALACGAGSRTRARRRRRPTCSARSTPSSALLARRGRATSTASRSTWSGVPPFHRRVYEVARAIPAGRDAVVRRDRGAPRRTRARRAPSGRRSGETRSRSSCRAIACSRPAASWAASPRAAASRRSCACSRSKARATTGQLALFDGDGAFGFDPSVAVAHLRAADPALARVIDAVGPFAHASSSGRRASSARSRRPSSTSSSPARPRRRSSRASARSSRAPTTARRPSRSCAPPTTKLRGAGLSRAKLLALRDLARRSRGRRDPDARRGARHGRRGDRRAAHAGARHRPLDGRDAADVPPRPPGRAARRRLRRAQGLRDRVQEAASCPRAKALARSAASGGRRTAPWRAGISGAPRSWRGSSGPRRRSRITSAHCLLRRQGTRYWRRIMFAILFAATSIRRLAFNSPL